HAAPLLVSEIMEPRFAGRGTTPPDFSGPISLPGTVAVPVALVGGGPSLPFPSPFPFPFPLLNIDMIKAKMNPAAQTYGLAPDAIQIVPAIFRIVAIAAALLSMFLRS